MAICTSRTVDRLSGKLRCPPCASTRGRFHKTCQNKGGNCLLCLNVATPLENEEKLTPKSYAHFMCKRSNSFTPTFYARSYATLLTSLEDIFISQHSIVCVKSYHSENKTIIYMLLPVIAIMKALKCKTLGECVAWQVMVKVPMMILNCNCIKYCQKDAQLHALLSHKLILLPSHLSALTIMLKGISQQMTASEKA